MMGCEVPVDFLEAQAEQDQQDQQGEEVLLEDKASPLHKVPQVPQVLPVYMEQLGLLAAGAILVLKAETVIQANLH